MSFASARLIRLLVLPVACGCASDRPPAKPPPPLPPAASAPAPRDVHAFRTHKPAPGEAGRFAYPIPEMKKLDNGLELYVVHRPAGVVALSVVVRHGASDVPAGKSGLAALTARMLTEGTQKKSAFELAKAAESLGSTLEADAERDASNVSLLVLRSDVERGLSLLAEVVQKPAFSAKELERVRGEWIDNLTAERQDPKRLAPLAGLRLLFGEPLGAPVAGSIPHVRQLKTTDLITFHRSRWVPSSAAVIAVGDLRLGDVEAKVRELFGAWRAPAAPARPKVEAPRPLDKLRAVLVDRPDAVQTAVFVVQPFPERAAPGHEARQLLSSVLGGLFTSRINYNLREVNAYTYGARSQAVATRHFGAFLVMTSVKTEVTGPALEQLLLELRSAHDPKTKKPIAADELARARADLINSLGAHLEHTAQVAGDVSTQFVHELPADYHARYSTLLGQVNREAVVEQATRQLQPDRLLVVLVGDREKVAPQLNKFGISPETADPKLVE
jgi:zinc protease